MSQTNPYQETMDWYDKQMAPEPSEEDLSRQRLSAIESEYQNILKKHPDRDPYVLEQGMQAIREDPIAPLNYPTADDLETWGNERIKANEPGYGEVIGKGIMRGVEGLAGGVGSVTRWAGEATGIEPMARVGKEASQYWTKAQQEGTFAPDKGLYRGTFMENPSIKRAVGIVSEAAPSMGVGFGVGTIAKGASLAFGLSKIAAQWIGSLVAGSSLGLLEGAPQYEEAREAGKSVGEASVSGLASTAGTAILESLAIGKFLKLGKQAERVGKKAGKIAGRFPAIAGAGTGLLVEGMQEGSQQLWQNLVAKVGYDDTRELAEGLVEAIIGGAGAGGIAGGTIAKLNKMAEKAKEKGLTDEDVSTAIEDLKGQIEDVAQGEFNQVVQTTPEQWQTVKDQQGPQAVAAEIFNQTGALDDTLRLRSVRQPLADPQASIVDRLAAVDKVKAVLKGINANLAKTWTDNTYQAIYNDLPIPMGNGLAATEIDDSAQMPVSPVDQKIAQAFDVLDRKFGTRSGGTVENVASGIVPTGPPMASQVVEPTQTPAVSPTALQGPQEAPEAIEELAQGEETIPTFNNTEEALAFGETDMPTPGMAPTGLEKLPDNTPGAELANGFRQGPRNDDSKYRVRTDTSTSGILFERHYIGVDGRINPSTYYIGKDGKLDVFGRTTDMADLMWVPENAEQEQAAVELLDEMGKTSLSDPRYNDFRKKLKDLVVGKSSEHATPAPPSTPAPVPPTEIGGGLSAGLPPSGMGVHGEGVPEKVQVEGASPESGDYAKQEPQVFRGNNVDTIVSPSAKRPNTWQVTSFDKEETPLSDEEFDSYEDAVNSARREAGITTAEEDEAFKELEAMPTPQPVAEEVKGKEPWEMTKSQYKSANPIRSAAFRMKDGTVYEGVTHPQIAIDEVDSGNVKSHKDFYDDKAEPGFVTVDGEFIDRDKALELVGRSEAKAIGGPYGIAEVKHRKHVEKALSEGKPIPEAVLKEYPDLTPPQPGITPVAGEQGELPDVGTAEAEPEAGKSTETKRFYNKVLRNRNNAQELKKLGIESQQEADRALAMMGNGSTKGDVLYTINETKTPPTPEPKPTSIGTAWVKNQWRPVTASKQITRGKNQGKWNVTLPDGSHKIVETVKMAETPGVGKEAAPAIVDRALKDTVTDIGQLSKDEKRALESGVRSGVIAKGKGGPFPAPKTVYAKPGYDFKGEREKAYNELKGIANKEGGKVTEKEAAPAIKAPKIGMSVRQTNTGITYKVTSVVRPKGGNIAYIEAVNKQKVTIKIQPEDWGKRYVINEKDDVFSGFKFKEVAPAKEAKVEPQVTEKEEPRFQTFTPPPDTKLGVSRLALEHVTDIARRGWANAPKFVIVDSQDKLPPRYNKEGKIISGAYVASEDTVYLVAGNMPNINFAVRSIFHEAWGHKGFDLIRESKQAEAFNKFLDRLYATKKADIDKVAQGYEIDVSTQQGRNKAIDEWLARQAEKNPNDTWVKRAVAFVRRWIAKVFPGLKVSNSEIVKWLGDMRQGVIEGEPGVGTRTAEARYEAANLAAVWHSQMQNVLAQKLPGAGTPAQIKQAVTSWANKGEYKAEELEWSGLNEWLDKQTGKVTKQQVIEYLQNNDVRIDEVVKGEPTEDDIDILLDDEVGEGMTREEAREYLRGEEDRPKFTAYQLPGGENYKEMLLTLPRQKKTPSLDAYIKHFYGAGGEKWLKETNPEKYKEAVEFYNTDIETGAGLPKGVYDADGIETEGYRSSHWDEPNVLAHVRMNDRTGPNGEKVLFLEEVQSDWHQAGRKQGYNPNGKAQKAFDQLSKELEERYGSPKFMYHPDFAEQDAIRFNAAYKAVGEAQDIEGPIPDAPFKKTWPMLAIKRMVRYASENGYDSIAWTPGEVQAERYDLSKHIDDMTVYKLPDGYAITGKKDGKSVLNKTGVQKDKLSDYIGKELSEKVLAETSYDGSRVYFSNIDLKVGGEGMKGFYDKILPAEVNKFFGKKAWGNAKVEAGLVSKAEMSPGEKLRPGPYAQEVWTLPITPAMRYKALTEGMPRFQLAGEKAIGAPTGQLAKAQKMLAEGKSEQEVWDATGWTREASGKFAFRIDDSGAKKHLILSTMTAAQRNDYNNGEEVYVELGDLLIHDTLFKAYPQLKQMKVWLDNHSNEPSRYVPSIATTKYANSIILTNDTKDTLLHEVQHAIQEIEGFARGATPESYLEGWQISDKDRRNLQDEVANKRTVVELFEEAEKTGITATEVLDKKNKRWGFDTANDRVKELLDTFTTKDEAEQYWKEDKTRLDDITEKQIYEPSRKYTRTAGELYAREAGAQFKGLPGTMEGIPREQWIVKDGEGTSFSAGLPLMEAPWGWSPSEIQQFSDKIVTYSKKGTSLKTLNWILPDGRRASGKGLHETDLSTFLDMLNVNPPQGKQSWKDSRITQYDKLIEIRKNIPLIRVRGSGKDINLDLPEFITSNQFAGLKVLLTGKSSVNYDVTSIDGKHVASGSLNTERGERPLSLLSSDVLKVVAYKSSMLADGTSFSVELPDSGKQDATYLSLAERYESGDKSVLSELQRMVDEKTKASQYVTRVYRGTTEQDETVLPKSFEAGGGIFTTNSPEVAEIFRYEREYGEVVSEIYDEEADEYIEAPKGDLQNLYVRLDNPLILDENSDVNAQDFVYDTALQSKIIRDAVEKGYDGIIVKDVMEGVGDWMEEGTTYVVFDPRKVKSADPITRDDQGRIIPLSKRFNPQEEDIRYSAQTPEEYAREFLKAYIEGRVPPPSKDLTGFDIEVPETPMDRAKATLSKSFDKFMYWVVDKNRPIASVQKRLPKLSDEVDVFLKETQRPKRAGVRIKAAWNDSVVPLINKLAEYKIDLADFELYKHALHAPEANDALRKANAKMQVQKIMDVLTADGQDSKVSEIRKFTKDLEKPAQWYNALNGIINQYGDEKALEKVLARWEAFSKQPSGMMDEQAAEILKQHKGNAKMEEAGRMLDDINAQKLQLLYDSGLLSQDEFAAFKKKYSHYVPLYREGYDDSLFGVSRGIKPSGRMVKTRGGSVRKVVNIFAHSVANYEKAINASEKARSQRALYNLIKDNPDNGVLNLEPVHQSPRYDDQGNLRMYPNMFEVADNEMRLMVDGKQHLVTVDRDNRDAMLMMRTLKSEENVSGPIINTLAKVNRFLAKVNTSWSPEFIVTNFMRDIQTAGINIKDTGVKGKGMLKGAAKAWKAIFAVEQGKPKGTELEKYYERFKMAGGKIAWADVHGSVENLSKKVTAELEMRNGKRPTRKVITEWLKLIDNANTSIENGIRLHVFKLAVEQGKTDERAAQIASDLTVDFTKKGAAGPVINSLYLFANAGIQGSYRILRAATKSRAVQKHIAAIAAGSFVIGMLNALAGGEDDDGEDYFNKIDNYLHERNLIIMIPGTKGRYVKIPLPWGYNVIWNFGTELSRAFTKEDYSPMEAAVRLASTLANAFNPVASGTFLQTIAPTILDPIAQVAENKNWFGGPLMPDKNVFAKVPTPDSQRYWSRTGTASKWVASQLNWITGGDKVKAGIIDVSPETLNLIVDSVGGSALRFVKDSLGLPLDVVRKEEVALQNIPFVRRVVGEKSDWADSRTYFQNAEHIYTAEERLKAYRGTQEFRPLFEATTFERSMIPMAKSVDSQLRKLRKAMRSSKARNDDETVKRIEERMNHLYMLFNKRYYERRRIAANE